MVVSESAPATTQRVAVRPIKIARISWYPLGLLIVLGVAVPMHVVALDREGYGNTYYAAAVKSMLTSWHNFFFVSFDAGGFVSVDKPPLGLWIQAVKRTGLRFSPAEPPLAASAGGCRLGRAPLSSWCTRVLRSWSPAWLPAAALAVTPISVVTNRNNTCDSVLVLVVARRGLGGQRRGGVGAASRWLLLGGVLVGLGFNIKMLEAYLDRAAASR